VNAILAVIAVLSGAATDTPDLDAIRSQLAANAAAIETLHVEYEETFSDGGACRLQPLLGGEKARLDVTPVASYPRGRDIQGCKYIAVGRVLQHNRNTDGCALVAGHVESLSILAIGLDS
jgi:hypothetical protein